MRPCRGCTPLPARFADVPPIAPDGVQHPLEQPAAPAPALLAPLPGVVLARLAACFDRRVRRP